MPDHLDAAILALAPHCEVATQPAVNGWVVDAWTLSPEAVARLGEAYKAVLLPPSIDSDVVAMLAERDIDVGSILLDEENANDTVTRSDMTEIAAAVALTVVEGLAVEGMHLPNVPKGQRNVSAPGLDIIGAHLHVGGPPDSLGTDEFVLLCSVKHTVTDPGDARSKLAQSLGATTLTVAYVGSQLRLLDGKLMRLGHAGGRVFLALAAGIPSACLRLVGVCAVDAAAAPELNKQLVNLPLVNGHRVFRQCFIPGIGELHHVIDQ